MCKIDWHLLFEGVAALGTVSVAIIAIWGDSIKYYFNPPKLRIEFEYEQLIGKYDNIEKSFTYFLKVVNKRSGSAPAKNCKIILSEIQEKIDGKFVSVPIKGTLYFIWSPKDSNPINYLKDYVIEDYFYFFKAFAERALPELNAYTRDFNGYLKWKLDLKILQQRKRRPLRCIGMEVGVKMQK